MSKKDIENMTPEEIEESIHQLPTESPPRMSSVGWLAVLGVIGIGATILKFNNGDSSAWILLLLTILSWIGVVYLWHKIITFKPGGKK
jgi:hypothetical protein